MAQSRASVESITIVTQEDLPDLVRQADLPSEGRKRLSKPTCQEDITCTETASSFKEGK